MRYFGVPTCPYCKKRVNLIRTWSLKRQGEYQCPRCSGISNIHLSPLIYVLGLLAVFGGGVMYFFHKFVLDDITLETALYVFLPFAVFFFFSLFMVYLEKPVIKKISRAEYEKKRRFRPRGEEAPATNPPPGPEYQNYFDEEDYVPRNHYRPGPSPQTDTGEQGIVNQQAFDRARQQAAVENSQRVSLPGNVSAPRAPRPAQPAGSVVQRVQGSRQPQPKQQAQPIQPVPRRQGMQGAQNTAGRQGIQSFQRIPTAQRPAAAAPRTQAGYGQAGRPAASASVSPQRMSFAQQGAAAQHRAGQQGVGQRPVQGTGSVDRGRQNGL